MAKNRWSTVMPGKYYEEFKVGEVIEHRAGRTITEADNTLFCALTMNNQPLHLDEEYAKSTQFGRRVVNGIYVVGLAVGISVEDTTAGTIVANLGFTDVEHPRPVFIGDTIRVKTVVKSKRPSSKPGRGLVEFRHIAVNQKGEEVLTLLRKTLVQTKPAGK